MPKASVVDKRWRVHVQSFVIALKCNDMADPVLWKYKTAHGDDAVTDRWEDIPAAQRSHAQPFTTQSVRPASEASLPVLSAMHFEPFSFGGGLLVGAAVAMLFARSRRTVLLVAVVTVIVVVGMGAYLGFLRRQAGLSSDALASPQEMMGEVHDAAGAMKNHFGEQQKTLDQIDASGK